MWRNTPSECLNFKKGSGIVDKEAVLLALVRNVICGDTITDETKTACTEAMLESVYMLAAKHDLAHLVGQAVGKLGLPNSEILTKCKRAAMSAFLNHARQDRDFHRICDALEKAKISFIPLKGAVLRKHYPEAWMRSSCDVDILIQKADLDAASALMTGELGFAYADRTGHDVSFISPDGVHIELHFDLIEDGRANASNSVLRSVWEDAQPADGSQYWYVMSDRFFYFYHIAHMAKHVETGGCGIRPFIDLWLLDNVVKGDLSARDELLQTGQLLSFATAARKLSRVWLAGEEKDSLSVRLENFLLHGGVYGSTDNRVALHRESRGGKIGYLLSRIFAPFDKLKSYYPILEKHPYLMPIMQVRRWLLLLRPDVARRARNEISINNKAKQSPTDAADSLLSDLGIHSSAW